MACTILTWTQAHSNRACVAHSVERWPSGPGSQVRFPAGGLGVAFSSWVLKCISLYIYMTLEFMYIFLSDKGPTLETSDYIYIYIYIHYHAYPAYHFEQKLTIMGVTVHAFTKD